MKPLRLYIENFMCHEKSDIDFTQFSSALIVGKIDGNELFSNGVGKSSIFKAIEYVLFNEADVNLEKIIRDDTQSCKIVFDFICDNQIYRISRARTRKGTSDLSLYERTGNPGTIDEINDINSDKKFWKDISGRRTADTEKDLSKIIKINYKSFISTVHFIQNDFSGLTTATPEKRKALLKDILDLSIYSKLEKLAKDKLNIILKLIDKNKTLIEALGDPDEDYQILEKQIIGIEADLTKKNLLLADLQINSNGLNESINLIKNQISLLEEKNSNLITREQIVLNEKSKIEISIKEYTSKKLNIIKSAKDLVEEVKFLKEMQLKLAEFDYSQIDILTESISQKRDKVAQLNLIIQNNMATYEELKIPMPDDSVCKHCRQVLSDEHKLLCKKKISEDMNACQEIIKSSKKEIAALNSEILQFQQTINSLNRSKQQLEDINIKITNKNKEIQDKRGFHEEYSELLNKFELELIAKASELESVREEIKNSSIQEIQDLKSKIEKEKSSLSNILLNVSSLHKEISHLDNSKAVILHSIDQKKKESFKKKELQKELSELEEKSKLYPLAIQGYSSIGIPNLIIQNVLDELQIESNTLLNQLKPGLQLSFMIEKSKDDGTLSDTLDINYFVNGKSRDYNLLSGAMKLAVTFSLKLGLSFLLQREIGSDIKFLMLDELDQSLDKATVDAFADIVKFFQKDFTILVITHNDRLKDKFSHAILVEQDMNMVSRAKVVSSW
jgi:DNA repair exonuclease SbcCD ATPase subunit